jgi:hypothetical protein
MITIINFIQAMSLPKLCEIAYCSECLGIIAYCILGILVGIDARWPNIGLFGPSRLRLSELRPKKEEGK